MKKLYYISSFVLFLLLVNSCNKKDEELIGSNIDTETPILNETDKWLRDTYTSTYNIEVLYKWEAGITDFNRYLHPPLIENVKPAMEAIKSVWVDPYTQLGGADFLKKIAPREIVLIGGQNINPGGQTSVLGLAEAGARIIFFKTDEIDLKNKAQLIEFVGTIQHEYIHILNQTIPFDEVAYKQITPSNYTGQWFESTNAESRELGYITAYARANEREDFAEMINEMLSNTKTEFDNIVNSISNATARQNIRRKEAMVVDYYRKNFNIDLYELQTIVAENVEKLIN